MAGSFDDKNARPFKGRKDGSRQSRCPGTNNNHIPMKGQSVGGLNNRHGRRHNLQRDPE